ncbi:hypothetical protein A3I56_03515 [Candidatus Roizmanbacteria bacterium RIFCSPLOWO2_02_FULL_43_10]|uniref:Polymerase beta nucleotidyltransferase domain-containing protein n=2 Tax=Candidatus Roizmaniibacteriota TaxID=1752723 RepID=A0A1F7JT71_9BACT|nr:MAG: hypothetical protein A3F32_02600 [Candidatus Roizmanbacteria bacterium RIFCSPHIGHO2_12_FULL_42_10]OGK58803.1 MAG: hypothetical protein A3I56_03515 [Candidatus Roizmanbacteria bacterium RIFCSPLOWO2_02_FULL_43_10]
MLTKQTQAHISEYFEHEPVEVVFFFGSRASGYPHGESDYDFGVVFSKGLTTKQRSKKRLTYIGELGKILGVEAVDVVDLEKAPAYLRYAAFASRQDIVCKNESVRINFEHKAMSNYFDRLPYMRRHSSLSIASIARHGLS